MPRQCAPRRTRDSLHVLYGSRYLFTPSPSFSNWRKRIISIVAISEQVRNFLPLSSSTKFLSAISLNSNLIFFYITGV